MNKKIIAALQYCFFFGLGIFLVWWSLHQIPDDKWVDFKNALATTRYWMIVPVFLILSGSHLLRALRWRLLMEPMGYKPSLANSFFAVMVGYLANLAVPRLGEVLKCTILARYEKVPAENIVGTIVAERAFDVICLGIVFLLALFFQFDVVMQAYEQLKQFTATLPKKNEAGYGQYIFWAVIAIIIAGIVWMVLSGKWKILQQKIVSIIKGIWAGVTSALKLKNKLSFFIYTTAIWGLYIMGTWIGLKATEGTAAMGIEQAISGLAFASIGMILTPGGIGAYAWLLAKVLEYNGVPNEIGLANGNLQWLAQCFIVLIMGFLSLSLLPWYNKKYKHEIS